MRDRCPWLDALARLERTYVELFDGPDAEVLTLDALRRLGPEGMLSIPLRLVPCCSVLEHQFAIAPLWQTALERKEVTMVAADPETLVVWRQDVQVRHRPIDSTERSMLAVVQDGGGTLLGLCSHVDSALPVEEAAHQVMQIVRRWIGEGLLQKVRI